MPENKAPYGVPSPSQLTATEVRALRDKVYGSPCGDREWQEFCGIHWMRPDSIAWLQEKAQHEITL